MKRVRRVYPGMHEIVCARAYKRMQNVKVIGVAEHKKAAA